MAVCPSCAALGGLVDTVKHHEPAEGSGTGYCFDRYEPLDLYTCMVRAWEGFRYKDAWQALQKRGMQQNFSWSQSAVEYVRLYSEILGVDYQTQLDVRPKTVIPSQDKGKKLV